MKTQRILRQAFILCTVALFALLIVPSSDSADKATPKLQQPIGQGAHIPAAAHKSAPNLPAVMLPKASLAAPGMAKAGVLPHFKPGAQSPAGMPTGPLQTPGMAKAGVLPHFKPGAQSPAGIPKAALTPPKGAGQGKAALGNLGTIGAPPLPTGAEGMMKVVMPKPGGEAGVTAPINVQGTRGAVIPIQSQGKAGLAGMTAPTEQNSLNLEEIKVTYTESPVSSQGKAGLAGVTAPTEIQGKAGLAGVTAPPNVQGMKGIRPPTN